MKINLIISVVDSHVSQSMCLIFLWKFKWINFVKLIWVKNELNWFTFENIYLKVSWTINFKVKINFQVKNIQNIKRYAFLKYMNFRFICIQNIKNKLVYISRINFHFKMKIIYTKRTKRLPCWEVWVHCNSRALGLNKIMKQ